MSKSNIEIIGTIVDTPKKLNNGYRYLVEIVDTEKVSNWFSETVSKNKKLLYPLREGGIENILYVRGNNQGTYPAGCGLQEKCVVSLSINESGYIQTIVRATDAAKRTVEKQKVAVMATKQAMVEDAELFAINLRSVQAAEFSKKYNLDFDKVHAVFTAEQPKQQQSKPKPQPQPQPKPQPQPQPDQQPEPELFGEED